MAGSSRYAEESLSHTGHFEVCFLEYSVPHLRHTRTEPYGICIYLVRNNPYLISINI